MKAETELQLMDEISKFYADPLGFIMYAFDWGNGDLLGFDGPDDWQIDILNTLGEEVFARKFNGIEAVDPIQVAVSSGHG